MAIEESDPSEAMAHVLTDLNPAPSQRLSAKAARKDGALMTEAEIETAEEEAEAWARRANSC